METGKFNIANWMVVFERYPMNTLIRACIKLGGMSEKMAADHIQEEIRIGTIYEAATSTTGEPLYQKSEVAISTRNQDKEVPAIQKPKQNTKQLSGYFNPNIYKCWI